MALAATDQLTLLVGSVRDYAIFLLDVEGYVMSWNAGAERIKGYRADEIIGRHFSVFYPPDVARTGHPANELRIAAAEGRYEEEGWRIRKDGSAFWADVVITALRDDAGKLVGYAKVTRDLTERKRAEEQRAGLLEQEHRARLDAEDALRQLRESRANTEAALEAVRVRDEFTRIAAHELRTPLTGAQGAAQLLHRTFAKASLTPTQQRSVAIVEQQVKRLARLVERLLDAARVEAEGLPAEPIPTDLVSLTRSAVDEWRALSDREFRLHAPDELIVSIDPMRIDQVLTNLIENATKYSVSGPIDVSIATTTSAAVLAVRDRGIGVDPESRPRIFERYYQAHPDRSGLGLGLYITREIVQTHGGTIHAEFPPDGGTRFVVTLPLA